MLTIPARPWWLLFGALVPGPMVQAQFVDSCFTSIPPGTTFDIFPDIGGFNADLLEWTGSEWIGDWPNAFINLPPPSGSVGCRVIFIGSGIAWTTGGEGFGLRLTDPLVAGQAYDLTFNSVSHGTGSDGAFTFDLYSNTLPDLFGADYITTTPAVGYTWTMITISFVATGAQDGDDWIVIHNGASGSSGLISSFCSICSDFPVPCPPVSLGDDAQACAGDILALTVAVPDGEYLWSDGSTDDSLLVSATGEYWLQVTTPECVLGDTISVTVTPRPVVDLPADFSLCAEDSVLLQAFNDQASYLWNAGSTAPAIWAHPPGNFAVQVNIGPCTASDSVSITVIECTIGVEMPNVFSPNGDGQNDTFSPLLCEGMANGALSIFNRWGTLLETVDLPAGWNGKRSGSACPEGTYFWTMVARSRTGQEVRDHGSVTLVR